MNQQDTQSQGSRLQRHAIIVMVILVPAFVLWHNSSKPVIWTEPEKALLQTLQIANLQPLPPDPSNAVSGSPQAAMLGHQLFFDTRLSLNQQVSCATCHQPALRFTDGIQTAQALGHSLRNTPSIVGLAYSPWYYWDGRKDSQWAQALAPLEDAAEHGSNRMRLARLLTLDSDYSALYSSVFGDLPDFSDQNRFPEDAGPVAQPDIRAAWESMTSADQDLVNRVFSNMGKALAAYERLLMPGVSRFDLYARAVLAGDTSSQNSVFSDDEKAGLKLFLGPARCLECHNGPLFTNNEFHNTGLLPLPGTLPDAGRSSVIAQLRNDPFNCLGNYSDAGPGQCKELVFMREGAELIGAMRTPSLRNLGNTAPYMHKGQLANLPAVLTHYNRAAPALIGHNEASELNLNSAELQQLGAFLLTLDGPLDTDPFWLSPPEKPTRQIPGQPPP